MSAYASLNDLDRLIERDHPHVLRRGMYYVEAGANDGLTQSNTYFLERKFAGHGVLVEPAPQRFAELVRNRSKKNRFFRCALVPFGYPDKEVPMLYADLMSVAFINSETDLNKDRDAIISSATPHLRGRDTPFDFTAPARTLNDVLAEAGAPKIVDLLSLDVEGNELNVLSGVDHAHYRFRHILVEARDEPRMSQFLAAHGYRLVARLSHHDYLYGCDVVD
ncbi:MAG: FkbM family methyltransferase [Rhodospirillaceae bacterium]|nr:FkbM family methyltransferase [Rhodospirillaceae bacterium]